MVLWRRRGEIGVTLTTRVWGASSSVLRCCLFIGTSAQTRCRRLILNGRNIRDAQTLEEDVWSHWEFGLWGVFASSARFQHHGFKSALRRGRGRRTSQIHLERVLTPQAVWMGAHRCVHYCFLRLPHRKLAGWVWISQSLRVICDARGVSATFTCEPESYLGTREKTTWVTKKKNQH